MSQTLKTALLIALPCVVLGLPQKSLAQDARIAVVNTEDITNLSDEGKAANEKMDKRFQELSGDMQRAQKDIDEKESQLKARERLMSATAKTQLQREIADDKLKLDRKDQDYQKIMAEMQNELIAPIGAKAQVELQALVSEKGYTLVIDLSAENGNVVWNNPNNDITKEVIRRMNETRSKESGGTTAPAKPAASSAPATPRPAATTTPAPATPRPAGTTPTTTPATPRNP